MKLVTAKSETNLADLTRRVFDITGPKAAAVAKQAEAALLQANPHLRGVAKVPAGTMIVVPEVPGAISAGPQLAMPIGPEIIAHLKRALAGATAAGERSVANEVQDTDNTSALVKSRELKDLAKKAPDLQKRLAQLADQTKNRVKDIEARKTAQAQGLAQLDKDLGEFSR